MLVINHIRDVWDKRYDVAYHVEQVMGRQLEFIDESGKTCKVNVLDVKITYPVNELIKCLLDEKSFLTYSQVLSTSKTYRGPALVLTSKYIT